MGKIKGRRFKVFSNTSISVSDVPEWVADYIHELNTDRQKFNDGYIFQHVLFSERRIKNKRNLDLVISDLKEAKKILTEYLKEKEDVKFIFEPIETYEQ